MNRPRLVFLVVAVLAFSTLMFGQSSGNFTYGTTGNTLGCVLDNKGVISGGTSNCGISVGASNFTCSSNQECLNILGSNSGATCDAGEPCTTDADCGGVAGACVSSTCSNMICETPNPGTAGCIGSLKAAIKTNSGSGNVFVVRPSAVIALLTDVTLSSKQSGSSIGPVSSTALAGIDFAVSVTPAPGSKNLVPAIIPNFAITYDARFIQITTNLFQALTTQCSPLANGCFLTLAESTAAAHSFDWIVGSPAVVGGNPLGSGTYDVEVDWTPSTGFTASGIAQAAACVGPVNLTVTQNKIFSFNTVNQF